MRGSGDPGPWVDSDYVLQSGLPRFRWAGVGVSIAPKKPPSIFNSHTYLRLARRRGRWVAMLWDKRDDDLVPFDNLPVTLSLTKGGRRATVTLRSHYWMYAPPAVPLAEVAFTGDQHRPVSITLTSPQRVWRVRMAAFSYLPSDPNHAPAVTMMLDVGFERHFVTTGSQRPIVVEPEGTHHVAARPVLHTDRGVTGGHQLVGRGRARTRRRPRQDRLVGTGPGRIERRPAVAHDPPTERVDRPG